MSDEKALELKKQAQTLADFISGRKGVIVNAMSDLAKRYMTAEKLVKLLMVAVARQPKLLECTPQSILMALVHAAEVALDPTGKSGQAWLVPFQNNRTGQLEAQFVPGYRGLVLNLLRTDAVLEIRSGVAYDGEVFEHEEGLQPILRHVPSSPGFADPKAEWNAITHAYAIATLPNGTQKVRVVRKGDLERIRKTSKAQSGPWMSWPGPMSEKTAVKQLQRLLPVETDSLAERTRELDDAAETGEAEPELAEGLVEAVVVPPTRTQALKQKLEQRKTEAEPPEAEERKEEESEVGTDSEQEEEGPPQPAGEDVVGERALRLECRQLNMITAETKAILSLWREGFITEPTLGAAQDFLESTPTDHVIGPQFQIKYWKRQVYDTITAKLGISPPLTAQGAKAEPEQVEGLADQGAPPAALAEEPIVSLEYVEMIPRNERGAHSKAPDWIHVGVVHTADRDFEVLQHQTRPLEDVLALHCGCLGYEEGSLEKTCPHQEEVREKLKREEAEGGEG